MNSNHSLLAAACMLLGLAGCAGQPATQTARANDCALSVQTRGAGTTCVMTAVTPPAPADDLAAQMERERMFIQSGQDTVVPRRRR